MTEFTLKEIAKAQNSLSKLMNQDALTSKMKHRLRVFQPIISDLQEDQNKLLKKHEAVPHHLGGMHFPEGKQANADACDDEWDELLTEKIEVKYIPISLKEIEAILDDNKKPAVKLNATDYGLLLGKFIEDDIEDEI